MSNYSIEKRKGDVVRGSVFDVANREQKKIEQVLADVEVVVLLDNSSSMSTFTSSRRSRYDLAKEALARVQNQFSGKVMLVSFNTYPKMEYGGAPESPEGSTSMGEAFKFVKEFDGSGVQFIIISDGEPTDGDAAITVTQGWKDPISSIFIGDDYDRGIDFLKRLTTGTAMGKVEPEKLGSTIVGFLTEGGSR